MKIFPKNRQDQNLDKESHSETDDRGEKQKRILSCRLHHSVRIDFVVARISTSMITYIIHKEKCYSTNENKDDGCCYYATPEHCSKQLRNKIYRKSVLWK